MHRTFIYTLYLTGLLIPLSLFAQSGEPADSTIDPLTRFSARWVESERHVELFWIFGNTDLYYGFRVQRRSTANPLWETLGMIETGQCETCLLFYSFEDPPPANDSYYYRLEMLRVNGNREYSDDLRIDIGSAKPYTLNQNYPNPFNNHTTIHYWLRNPADVMLAIYNIHGQQLHVLVDASQAPGFHQMTWNSQDRFGAPIASGTYFYQLRVDGDIIDTKRMLLVK